MSAKNRADLITKLYKFVKKEYQVITPPSNRSVLEHMLYACCLENSTAEAADDAFAKLQENYFDWNEVRVTTSAELAESCKSVSLPQEAGVSLKKALHGVFEHFYQFDLDFLKKENLSKSVQTFQKFNGVSPFIVSYVAQNGLGGHSIPIDRSTMSLFYILGIVSEDEATTGRVPGLERTIAKAKGIEFANLVHQFAVAFASSPYNTGLRDKLLKLNSDAKERFPKRGGRKKVEEKPEPAPEKEVVEVVAKKASTKKASTKKAATTKAKPKATKKESKKPVAKPAKKKPTSKSAKVTVSKTSKKKKPVKSTKAAKKKSPTKRLAKKKPR